MTGEDRVRFCGECKKNVYNLSALRSAEALELIDKTEGGLCVRFYKRTDGTVLTADCPVGLRAAARRTAILVTSVFAAILTIGVAVFNILISKNPELFASIERPTGSSGKPSDINSITQEEVQLRTLTGYISCSTTKPAK